MYLGYFCSKKSVFSYVKILYVHFPYMCPFFIYIKPLVGYNSLPWFHGSELMS
jgi:hypothetical protein